MGYDVKSYTTVEIVGFDSDLQILDMMSKQIIDDGSSPAVLTFDERGPFLPYLKGIMFVLFDYHI